MMRAISISILKYQRRPIKIKMREKNSRMPINSKNMKRMRINLIKPQLTLLKITFKRKKMNC